MRLLAAAFAVLALAAAPAAFASETHPSSLEIQQELWCDDCQTTLDDANAISDTPKIMAFIQDKIAAGETKTQIKNETVAAYRYHVSLLSSKTVHPKATLADLEGEVMCPVCNTTLDQSSSPAAQRIKAFISRRIAAGDSKNQIKDQARRRVRAGDPRRAAEEGLRPARLAAPDRGRARRSACPRGARLALEQGA